MKSFFKTLVVSMVVAASVAVAEAEDLPETPLGSSMEKIDKAFKSLGRALKTPDVAQKAAYLEWVGTMKAEAVKCRDLVPAKISELPADKQAELTTAYQKEMDGFIGLLEKLEKAVAEERWVDADAVIKDVRKAKSAGHETYKKE